MHLDGTAKEIVVWNNHANQPRNFGRFVAQVRLLTLDYISRKIFWVDTSERNIRVANLSNFAAGVKIIVQSNFHRPSALAVNPLKGVICWYESSSTDHRILMADTLGKNVRVLLNVDIDGVQALAVDFETNDLCWIQKTNGADEIECLTTDTDTRRAVFSESAAKYSFFSLTIQKEMIYWTGNDIIHHIRKNSPIKKSHQTRIKTAGIINGFVLFQGCSGYTKLHNNGTPPTNAPPQKGNSATSQKSRMSFLIMLIVSVFIC